MIGDGDDILIWITPRIDDGVRMRCPLMKNIFVDIELKVSSLIDQQTQCWNMAILRDLFYSQDVELILKMKIATRCKDFKVWKFNINRAYSVKSGYWLASRLSNSEILRQAEALPSFNPLKALVWDLPIPSKLRIFLWKILSSALTVSDGIANIGI